MSSIDSKKKHFENFLKNKACQYVIVVILIIFAVTIFVSFFNKNDSTKDEKTTNSNEYVNDLENRLENTLSLVDGAGKVSVVITVESGMETVLAMKTIKKETTNGLEIEETPILVNGKTVVIKEKFPEIIGVLIVAEGAQSISVLKRIQQATVSLLDINLTQIEILTMK